MDCDVWTPVVGGVQLREEHGTGPIIKYHLYSIIDRDIEDWTKKSLETSVVIRHSVSMEDSDGMSELVALPSGVSEQVWEVLSTSRLFIVLISTEMSVRLYRAAA